MSNRAGRSRRFAKQQIREALSVLSVVRPPALDPEDEALIAEMSREAAPEQIADGSCYDEGDVLPIDWGRKQFNRFCQDEAGRASAR